MVLLRIQDLRYAKKTALRASPGLAGAQCLSVRLLFIIRALIDSVRLGEFYSPSRLRARSAQESAPAVKETS